MKATGFKLWSDLCEFGFNIILIKSIKRVCDTKTQLIIMATKMYALPVDFFIFLSIGQVGPSVAKLTSDTHMPEKKLNSQFSVKHWRVVRVQAFTMSNQFCEIRFQLTSWWWVWSCPKPPWCLALAVTYPTRTKNMRHYTSHIRLPCKNTMQKKMLSVFVCYELKQELLEDKTEWFSSAWHFSHLNPDLSSIIYTNASKIPVLVFWVTVINICT